MTSGKRTAGIMSFVGSLLILTLGVIQLVHVQVKTRGPGEVIPLRPETEIKFPLSADLIAQGPQQSRCELKNIGESDVRVLSLSTSCGCSTPRLEREILRAGETVGILVEATPPDFGERNVTISVRTDSPITPFVNFRLCLIGSRQPPFMIGAKGDLAFHDPLESERLIEVMTVEDKPGHDRPLPGTSFPGLTIKYLSVAEVPYPFGNAVQRTYKFKVTLDWQSIQESTTGSIRIQDPWVSSHSQSLTAFADRISSVRVVPSRIVLQPIESQRRLAGEFVIISKQPGRKWAVSAESPVSASLLVQPVETSF